MKLLDSARFQGYRVRRQIDERTFQEYFFLRPKGKRLRRQDRLAAKAPADVRDNERRSRQQNLRGKAAKGLVPGILRLKGESADMMTPVFEVGCMSVTQGKIVNTTVSSNQHGGAVAWQPALACFTLYEGISKRSRNYRDLPGAKPTKIQVACPARKP